MSSPLSSLKKNKVPLFPGHMSGNRPIPFRHPEYSEDESRLLEEITTNMVQERRKRDSLANLPPINASNSPSLLEIERGSTIHSELLDDSAESPSDKELLRMMMNRVALLEQQNVSKEQELRAKDKRIKILEDKLQIMEKAHKENDNSQGNRQLEKHCLLLQQQVHEMETFLAEYGMVWVGDEDNDDSEVYLDANIQTDGDVDDDNYCNNDAENNNFTSHHRKISGVDNSVSTINPLGTWRQDTSLSADSSIVNLDFDLLVENIKDLNVLAGEGLAQIKKTSDGARFEIPDPVQLTLYANGILMFNGPFRPYSDPSTQQCIQDLLDGYFPSELQKRYPDGIPFRLTDLRNTIFQPKQPSLAFTGEGQTLGGETRPSRLIPSNYQNPAIKNLEDKNLQISSQLPGKPLTQTQFLNRLPKSVIKDGKVIDVRSSVGNTLTGNAERPKSNITLLKTNVTDEIADSVAAAGETPRDRPKSYKGHSDVTTLRVVTETGDHTYIVKMKFKETIGNLRTYLDQQRRPKVPYDIMSTFPHKVHKNNNMTLEASGLTPNAVIHLKPCPQ